MPKLLKKISALAVILSVLGVVGISSAQAQPGGSKCEKCFRGPDGKIKCEPVPCPK